MLVVRDLVVHFHTDFGVVKAVDGVSYSVNAGETLAIVGESGSGKSVNASAVLGLVPPPGKVHRGEIIFQGQDMLKLDDQRLREIRGNRIGMVFQDPLTSLNPVFSVGAQVSEAVQIHEGLARKDARERATELLSIVGIPRSRERFDDYPHQFSGGMRQRVMIAMAIAMKPALLIADEPTTALDVTVQAQILDLLGSLQQEFGMAMILITHDLGMVADQADTVAVMYAGSIVEYGTVDDIYYRPLMPYTLGLMASVARMDQARSGRLRPIRGQPPSLIFRPPGCPFHPRCDYAREVCWQEQPELLEYDQQHLAACHFAGNLPEPIRKDEP
ncbi:MAG: ABC transporter ATP-binding protein [Actinobacteria bacterium]|nr:ABC transporter ATP-binding protein [Actinomycetota bacterium]